MSLSINPTNDGWFFTMLVVHGMNPFVVLEFDQRLRDDDKTRAVCEQVNRLTLTSSPSRRVSSNSMLGLNSYDDDLSVDSLLNDHLPSCSLMINFGLINFADWRRRRLTPYRPKTDSITRSSVSTRSTYDFFHEVIEVFTIDVLPCTFKFLDSAGGGHWSSEKRS